MNADINKIHNYWFGPIENETTVENRNRLWFGGGVETDRHILNNFESLLSDAGMGRLDHWTESAKGTLCLIILLDQFPLNMYRKTARAFDFEAKAIEICLKGLQNAQDQELSFVEKSFFYMPLEHAENADYQAQCVALFEQLLESAPEHLKEQAQNSLDYAVLHKDIIDRFGRFPHRNAVLNRESTAEEVAFLKDQSNRFGQ